MPAKTPPPGADLHFKRPQPHQGHIALRKAAQGRRRVYNCAHRGWQKSTYIIDDMLDWLERGYDVGMYAQNYAPLDNNLVEMRQCLFPEEWFNKTHHTFSLPQAGTLRQYSMENPDVGRGPSFFRAYIEEAGTLADGVRDSIIYPIANKKGGTVIETGTPDPANPKNDFYDKIYKADEYPEDMIAFVIPILGGVYNQETGDIDFPPTLNPYCNPVPFPQPGRPDLETYEKQIEIVRRDFRMTTRPIKWRIEYLCEFISDEGSQFDGVEACCTEPVTLLVTDGIEEYWNPAYLKQLVRSAGWFQIGVDVGAERDYTVITVIDRNTMKQVYMRRFRPAGEKKYEVIKTAILRARTLFGVVPIVDCTGSGAYLRQESWLEPHLWTSVNKQPMYDHLAALIAGTKVRLFNEPKTKFELNLMQRTATRTGKFDIAAPKGDGKHDDIPASLVLMCRDIQPMMDCDVSGDIVDIKTVDSPWYDTIQARNW